jgi:hypothetical protein
MKALSRENRRSLDRAAPWGAAALFVAVNIWAAIVGGGFHAALERKNALEVLAEDRAVCTRLAAPPGSERFLACVIELDGVRQQAIKRVAAEELDLL